jgi:hypothetical protein
MRTDAADNDNRVPLPVDAPMRIFVFKSGTSKNLRAFAGDLRGSRLPEQFGPWQAIGAIAPDKPPPYTFPRDEVERSINEQGFQLWRMRPKKKQPT